MEEIGETTGKEIEKRKKDLINFFKQKTNLIFYGILAIIISVSVYIRTRPIPKLKDITTGTWTLGPDLDPFLFLRWAEYIAEHGKLFILDTMRYVPLAEICSGNACVPVNTRGETILLPYLIAWFSKFLAIFDKEATVTYAAIIFPVVMAVLTGIAFFLFARKIFYKENKKIANIIALIATTFFILIPSLLPRTIAGIPEKESAGFFFIFLGFYFFLEAFTSEKLKKGLIFGALAGITTGALALVWGGVDFLLLGISGAVLFSYFIGKINEKGFYIFAVWVIGFVISVTSFSIRYSFLNLLSSSTTLLVFLVLLILTLDFIIFKKKIFNIDTKLKNKIKLPEPIILFLIIIIIGIIFSLIFSENLSIIHLAKDMISATINPISQGRFSVTVAENQQPYFISNWTNEFGPVIFNIPFYFWLFFIGSVFLFNYLIKPLRKKEKILLTFSYLILILGLIFSKYAPDPHPLDGEGFLSLLVYFGGVLLFLGSFGYIYYKKYKAGELPVFQKFDFACIAYFILLTMTIIGARGAVRMIMILGAVSPIAVAFLIVKSSQGFLREKEDTKRLFIGIFVLIILLASFFTLYAYYRSDKSMAENYAPTIYTQQWQKAMAWVRDNTPVTAVFAHWWDYGYWVQSIGERATILDGGNAIGYWNYFMGRHVLTGTDEKIALDFLYAHNGTYLLIDSTDIGKYPAFSSIGSNENYDRYSWIPAILLDEGQTQETDKEIVYVYPVGRVIDDDIIINDGEKEILLPRKNAAISFITLKEGTNGEIKQPTIYFVYNENQYQMPLRYIYIKEKLYDFGTGIDAGIFVFPRLEQTSDGRLNVNDKGAAFYLSKRIIHSQLAKLYLFNEESDYFKLAHSEDSLIVNDLRQQGLDFGEFVYYQGLLGPIKIWKINYPSDIKLNEDFLSMDYPEELATITSGEY